MFANDTDFVGFDDVFDPTMVTAAAEVFREAGVFGVAACAVELVSEAAKNMIVKIILERLPLGCLRVAVPSFSLPKNK